MSLADMVAWDTEFRPVEVDAAMRGHLITPQDELVAMSQTFDTPGTRLLAQAMALLTTEGIRIESPGDGETVAESVAEWQKSYASGIRCDAIALTGPIAEKHAGLLLVRERPRDQPRPEPCKCATPQLEDGQTWTCPVCRQRWRGDDCSARRV